MVPVLPAKHQIKGIEDLVRLPSPATTCTGMQPKLPLIRTPQQSCLVPSKLLVRWQEGLASEKEAKYWTLTLQRLGRNRSTMAVRFHALICYGRHGTPADPRLVAKHLCSNPSCIHPEHIAWVTQSDNRLHACHKQTPVHFPKVAQNQQARAEARQAAASLYFSKNIV